MTNIHLRALMRPAQLVWATPGMMMILDDDDEEDNSILIVISYPRHRSTVAGCNYVIRVR